MGTGEGALACKSSPVGVGDQVGVGEGMLVGEGCLEAVGDGADEGGIASADVTVGVGEGWLVGLGVPVGAGKGEGVGVNVAGAPEKDSVRFKGTLAPLCQTPVWSASMPANTN